MTMDLESPVRVAVDPLDLAGAMADLAAWPIQRIRSSGIVLLRLADGNVNGVGDLDPEADDPGTAQVALFSGDPPIEAMSALESRLGRGLRWQRVSAADLQAFIAREEATRPASKSIAAGSVSVTGSLAAAGEAIESLSLEALDRAESTTVRAVNAALYDALRQGASDVHFESVADGLAIRFRVDGVLIAGPTLAGVSLASQVLSRLKVMAELDIAERRIPQDGRFVAEAMGRRIDFRVSVMPSVHGEDAVVRLLDRQHLARAREGLRLESLGFDPSTCESLRLLAAQPYGMLLVTGPTGSGKTTTLYALVSEVHDGTEKIVTIEDPIEYQLQGILQIPVNEKKGLTFARGLRSILRHDPDRIMVGEIRDAETAEIAVQSALTGHAVFTTVHANNVFDVVGRFAHMGIDLDNFVAAMNGIVAQRLLRRVCDACARGIRSPDLRQLRRSGLSPESVVDWRFIAANGCDQCRGTGYRGRLAIAEHLVLDDDLRHAIRQRTATSKLKRDAAERGFRSLRDQALALVRDGRTTLAECDRVTSTVAAA